MSRSVRCLHVFSTFDAGGPQVRTATLINALGAEFAHTVVAMDGRTSARQFLAAGAAVEVAGPPVARGPLFAPRMARWLRRHAPDLLLTYNWGAIESVLAGRLAGVRARIHAEDGFNADETTQQKRRRVWIRQLLLRGVPAVAVPSRRLAHLARTSWRVPEARLHHIDNGIDLERFTPGRDPGLRQVLGIPADALVVGTVAFLRPVKNTAQLLRAFARAAPPTAHLLVVGDGPDLPLLQALAGSLAIAARCHFPGIRPDPAPCYRAMDVFALASLSEQMPVSLIEAMACGLPVVATDVGDVASMVAATGRPGVVPVGDEAAYGAALGRLAGDATLRATLGTANRGAAQARFGLTAMLDRYRQLYRTVLAGAGISP